MVGLDGAEAGSSALYTCWRGLNLKSAFERMIKPQFEDTISLCIQLCWAAMVPAELLNIAHVDLHCGNVLLQPAPLLGEFEFNIRFELKRSSVLAEELKLKNDEPLPTFQLAFKSRFIINIIDWARIEAANLFRALPASLVAPRSPRKRRSSSSAPGDVNSSFGRKTSGAVTDTASFYNMGHALQKVIASLSSARVPIVKANGNTTLSSLVRLFSSGSGASAFCHALCAISASFPFVQVKVSDSMRNLMDHVDRGADFSFRSFDFRETVKWSAPAASQSFAPDDASSPTKKQKLSDNTALDLASAPVSGSKRGVGRPRKHPSNADRLRAYRQRMREEKYFAAVSNTPVATEVSAPAVDIFGAIYDTIYVACNVSQIKSSNCNILGVFATEDVKAGTVLTTVVDADDTFPHPFHGVGSVIQSSIIGSNVRRDGVNIIADRDISCGEELYLPAIVPEQQ